ncbi:alpha/beta hydrolase [Blastococcus sp. CT_GayMR16]|uniref:alpha/beta fold hydrolase n=1 Tax=Blastococcus sp. CT_GayMR16 TaxID=2559607 RepID=UPI0010732876|nr:alpha/beta hydrolase [Blastococcus sp. CT_GayMR16]TFV88819.1 alpha/beta hydrolase [Blastococcus sp. CT_GayMR16]
MTAGVVPGPVSWLDRVVEVEGAEIRYAVSGDGDRDLVLVHGRGAHHLWWHTVLPLLEPAWRITRVDLSGHGDSGHRTAYSTRLWSAELLAVCDAVGARRPVLVGHSMGGNVSLLTAVEHPERFAGLVMLDSGVRPPGRYRSFHDEPRDGARPPRGPRYAATREELLTRFRLMPPQPHPEPEVMAVIGEHSTRDTELGWRWKHDQFDISDLGDEQVDLALTRLPFAVGYVYGTESQVTDRSSAEYFGRVVAGARVEALPGAHHHVILERPERCAELIDEMADAQLRGVAHQ